LDIISCVYIYNFIVCEPFLQTSLPSPPITRHHSPKLIRRLQPREKWRDFLLHNKQKAKFNCTTSIFMSWIFLEAIAMVREHTERDIIAHRLSSFRNVHMQLEQATLTNLPLPPLSLSRRLQPSQWNGQWKHFFNWLLRMFLFPPLVSIVSGQILIAEDNQNTHTHSRNFFCLLFQESGT
jgi:hypothetical protein